MPCPVLIQCGFINDHTEGQRIGRPSPFAHVADNDLAVGLFVEYLSKALSGKRLPFLLWRMMQNGPDHVDALTVQRHMWQEGL
ncbi:MAG: hypothetical protein IPH18_10985 [Chitinophagaceae bacterium]|nr:hypothetical protein [Chitinophagaceae bacterium]